MSTVNKDISMRISCFQCSASMTCANCCTADQHTYLHIPCISAEVDTRDVLQVASAYGHEPVATTALLAYVLCHELHKSLEDKVNWLGVLGTYGDLGSGVKWEAPFPDMGPAIKQHGGKQRFSQAVSLINARKVPLALGLYLS